MVFLPFSFYFAFSFSSGGFARERVLWKGNVLRGTGRPQAILRLG